MERKEKATKLEFDSEDISSSLCVLPRNIFFFPTGFLLLDRKTLRVVVDS